MNALSIWFLAARPRTLALSITPVLVGSALAFAATGSFNAPAGVAALIAAMLIQIGTNLHNDAADSLRGADGPDRVGPLRVTASEIIFFGSGSITDFASNIGGSLTDFAGAGGSITDRSSG